jgi:hypothetical protein
MTAKRIAKPFALLATVAALVTVGAASGAAQSKERVGERINVHLGSPAQFPAGDPFHIAHGWGGIATGLSDYEAVGKWTFVLEVDGVLRQPDFVDRTVTPGSGGAPDLHGVAVVHNFPDGLAGTHTFVGRWIGPCQSLLESGMVAACEHATRVVEAFTRTLTVNFHEPVWNPGRDWRDFPNQANPSPDARGNPGVWSYLASASLVHDPTYSLLSGFSDLGGRQQWDAPGYINLLVGRVSGTTTMAMHSYGGRIVGDTLGRSAILGWTSPIGGDVRISGRVSLPDLSACNVPVMGSIWSIDKGAATLASAVLGPAGGTRFDLTTTVSEGEKLYFIHDPGYDSHCDMLVVDLEIEKT